MPKPTSAQKKKIVKAIDLLESVLSACGTTKLKDHMEQTDTTDNIDYESPNATISDAIKKLRCYFPRHSAQFRASTRHYL